ncbi:MAG: response regulator [Gammaproteobacteria bacterium]|nr:MAG: response regulator [Gammaproteobacteria bacterium]
MVARYHIHVVDDELTNIIFMEKMLKSDGFKVSVSRSGTECLENIRESVPDLILLDVMMPEMSGYETCCLMRQNPGLCRIPVIFVTALDDREAITKAYKSGATDYVVKPVRLEELREKIRAVLHNQNLIKDKERLLQINAEAVIMVRHILESLSVVKRIDALKSKVQQNNDTVCDLLQHAKLALANDDGVGAESAINQSLNMLEFTDETGGHLSAFAEALELISELMESLHPSESFDPSLKKSDYDKIDELISRLSKLLNGEDY